MDWASILAGFQNAGGLGGAGALASDIAPTPNFQERFAGSTAMPPMLPQPGMQSPISPEALASSAAARGVPPPPVDLTPPMRMPDAGAVDAWRNGVDADMGGKPGEVGAALTGKTMPLDIRPPVQQQQQDGATDMLTQSKPKSGMDKFSETLKGVKMPASPELQRLGTPAAPRPTTQIKGGDLIAFLQSLNASPGAASYNLPSTLGAAIRK